MALRRSRRPRFRSGRSLRSLDSPLNARLLGGFRKAMIRLGVAVLVCSMAGIATADWLPPNNPNPEMILDEAEADTAAGRYSNALAKHLWFHQNALRYAPAMYGVRLSFALSAWGNLACLFPPALEQLKAVRDEAAAAARDGSDPRHAFNDFASINRELREEGQTKDLFLWLDLNDASRAGQVFDIAEPALVEQKQYLVCGKYIDPQRSFERMLRLYREDKRIAKRPGFTGMKGFAEQSFAYKAATLVALLVLNERKADADRIAALARSASHSRSLSRKIDAALKGTCPERWP